MSAASRDVLKLGLGPDLDWLLGLTPVPPDGGGRIVFVSGDEGSGRRQLLQLFAADAARRGRARVIAGGFRSSRYVPSSAAPAEAARLAKIAEGVAAVAAPLLPVAALVAQLFSVARGGGEAVQAWLERQPAAEAFEVLPELLRRVVASEGPLVCVIDDAHRSEHGWWVDLMLSLGRSTAVDLPLLLVLGVDGPADSAALAAAEEPMLFVAHELVREELALWRPLGRAGRADVEAFIAPADGDVARALLETTAGRAGWLADVWSEWREREVVATDRTGTWRFADADPFLRLAPANHLLGRRLAGLVGNDVQMLARVRESLACGALEGRTFTTAAISAALGRDVEGEVQRVVASDPDGRDGLVVRADTVEIVDERGSRALERYRFVAEGDWLTLRHYGFAAAVRRQHAGALARALMSLYAGAIEAVAATAARLLAAAGDPAAKDLWRLHYQAGGAEAAVWRARRVLRSPPKQQYERNRAAELLLRGARALYSTGPWEEGLRFAASAAAFTDVPSLAAWGDYYAAWFHSELGDRARARQCLRRALRQFRAEGDRDGIANALHQLANQDLAEERYAEAETVYQEVLRLRYELGDHELAARALEALGDISFSRDEPAAAQERWEKALEEAQEAQDARSYATTYRRLAKLKHGAGERAEAREMLQWSLDVLRLSRDRANEYAALVDLASVEYDDERYPEALAAAEAAVGVGAQLGYEDGIEQAHTIIAYSAGQIGETERSRAAAELAAGLALARGDRVTAGNMADIVCDAAIADGDWELAQDAAARLSRLATELHDPRLAALARYQEARIAVHDRLPDEDREVFLLRIGAEDEDAAARSRAHLHLGSSAQEAGDLGRARHHYEQSILAAQADGDLGVEGVGWVHLSQVRYLQGARDEARERIEDAIRLLRHVEDEESLQAALEVRAAMGATD